MDIHDNTKFNLKSILLGFLPKKNTNMEITENIKILTKKTLNIGDLKLKGIKLGESYKMIPQNEIEDENIVSDEVRWINTEHRISYRTENATNDKIVEFNISNDQLIEELGIISEKKLVKKFGKPDELDKDYGQHYYFYSSKKLLIVWRDTFKKVLYISIGENLIQPKTYTAKDFLEKYLEFKRYVPNYENWNTIYLRGNPPRYYRFKELKALMKAFDIGTNLLQDFQNRGFLDRRTIEDFKPIYEDIEKYASQSQREKKWGYLEDIDRMKYRTNGGIVMIFQSFLRFAESLTAILQFNSGWLEAGHVSARYNINKTQKAIETFDVSKLEEIKQLLILIIDPKNKGFTRRMLIEKFDFPDVDLKLIDSDWV